MHTAQPRARIDAAQILANPEAFAHHPSLIALARLVAMSAEGHTLAQRRRQCRSPRGLRPAAPHLRVIEGGRARAGAQ